MIKIRILLIAASISLLLIKPLSVFAQVSSSGIAIPLPINDDTVLDGDVICSSVDGNKRCSKSYDPGMFGIYSANPAAEIKDIDLAKAQPVVTQGVTSVRVSAENGDIKEGSFLTTSSTLPGVAVLAEENGYVVGTALEAYTSSDKKAVGKISVAVNIHPESSIEGNRNNLLSSLRKAATSPWLNPVESLRYLLAVVIVLVSFILGLIYFGRASRTGIEAIGRNPLARQAIQTSIFLHVLLSLVIIMMGLGIAYLVLVL